MEIKAMSDYISKEIRHHAGLTFIVTVFPDYDMEAPWNTGEGWGKVRNGDYGKVETKKPGERIIHTNGNTAWLYDFADAMKRAKADKWGSKNATPDMSPGQVAELAVKEDMQMIRGYLTNEWSYIGIVVTLADVNGKPTDESESAWGLESFDSENIEDYTKGLIEELAAKFADTSEIVKTITIRK